MDGKGLSLSAAEREREDVAQARRDWASDPVAGLGGIEAERLVFLDQCGALANMALRHGRSLRGTRACASGPFGHWTRGKRCAFRRADRAGRDTRLAGPALAAITPQDAAGFFQHCSYSCLK